MMTGMEPNARRLTLEVEGGGEVIAGRMIDETGASVAFQGWLGLASALEHLLTPSPKPGRRPSEN